MGEPGEEPAKDVFDDEFAGGSTMMLDSGSEIDNVLENFEEIGSRANRRKNTSDKKVAKPKSLAAGFPIDAGATDQDQMVDVYPALLDDYIRGIQGRRRSEGQQDDSLLHMMSDKREQEALVSPEAFQQAQDQDDLNCFAEIPDHCLSRGSTIRESVGGGRRSTASPGSPRGSRVSGRHTGRSTGRYTQDQLEQVNYKKMSGSGASQRNSAGKGPERLSYNELRQTPHSEARSFGNEQDGILFELPASEYKDNSKRRAVRKPSGSGAQGSSSSSSSAPAAPAPSPMAPRVPQKKQCAPILPTYTPQEALGGRLDTIQSFVDFEGLDTKGYSPSHSTQSFPEPDADMKEIYESEEGAHSKTSTLGSPPHGNHECRKFFPSRDDESDEDTGQLTETLTLESFSESQAHALDKEPRYTNESHDKVLGLATELNRISHVKCYSASSNASSVKQTPNQRPRLPKAPASAAALDDRNKALGRDTDPLACSEDGAPPTKEAFEPTVAATAGEDSSAHAGVPVSPGDSNLPTMSSTVENEVLPRCSGGKAEDAAVEQDMRIRPPDSNRCASHGNMNLQTVTEGSEVAGVPSKDTCSPLTRRIRNFGSIRSAS